MHSLSQARDFAALAASARATAKRSSRKSAIALRSAASAFDAARTSLAPLDLEPARAGMRDLLAMALVWPEASPRQIEKGGDHIAARARRARRRAQGSDLVLRRHQWRKREKDRLYAATLLGANWPDERKKRLKRGAALADVLGDERDVLLLIGCIEGNAALTGGDGPARRALRALERRASRLARRADRLGVALHAGGA